MTIAPESPVCSMLRQPTLVDFAGHMAGVFLVSGCNFRCGFCHNAALLGRRQAGMAWERVDAACRRLHDNWATGAVISGGEPTLHEGLSQLIDRLRAFGLAIKLDTNGSRPAVLRRHLPRLDYVAMDIKAGVARYPSLTGWDDMGAIADSIDLLLTQARDYEFRTTVIEGIHDEAQVREIGAMIRGARRAVLQPFVPRDDVPDPAMRGLKRTAPDTMRRLRDALQPFVQDVQVRGDA